MTGRIQLGRLGAFALILALLTPAGETEAQPARKNQRVVILSNEPSPALDGLRHGLRDLGYVEGREVTLGYVWAGTQSGRFPALVAEVVRRKVDFIFTWGTPANLPAEQPTKYSLAVNLKTATTLGLTFPQSLIIRTDNVVQ